MAKAELGPADVVYARGIPDKQKRNVKDRPAVVLQRQRGGDGKCLMLVAVTGEFDPDDLRDEEVRLPSGNPNQPSRQGLIKDSVANCSWLAIVNEDDCYRLGSPLNKVLFGLVVERTGKAHAAGKAVITRDDREDKQQDS